MSKTHNLSEYITIKGFFKILIIEDLEYDGVIYKNKPQHNNKSFITPDNWNNLKDVFFQQRMEKYKDSYTEQQKINLEFDKILLLPLINDDFKVLADNYKKYLIFKNKDDNEDFIVTEENKQLLNRFIWKDKQSEFIEINKKFLQYWNDKKKSKKELIYYLQYLIEKDYFKKVLDGKKFKPTHGKDFLSLFFYGNKLALSEAKKKYYTSITVGNNQLNTFLHF